MKQLNRWVYAIAGVIVLLFAGLVYAWSVLSTPRNVSALRWYNWHESRPSAT